MKRTAIGLKYMRFRNKLRSQDEILMMSFSFGNFEDDGFHNACLGSPRCRETEIGCRKRHVRSGCGLL